MNRTVYTHGLLFAASLVAAYLVWTRDVTNTEEELIPILSIKSGIDKVIYKEKEKTVEMFRRSDETGTYYWAHMEKWITHPTRPKPPAPTSQPAAPQPSPIGPDGKPAPNVKQPPAPTSQPVPPPPQPEAKPAEPEREQVVFEFLGNDKAKETMETFATFSAIRALGKGFEQNKLAAFGLIDSQTSLTLVAGSTTRDFVIGGKTYGNSDSYVLDKQDGQVYVVKQDVINALPFAEHQLQERKLHSFAMEDIDRLVVKAGNNTRTFTQKNRQAKEGSSWSIEGTNAGNETYKTWVQKLFNPTIVVGYVTDKDKLAKREEVLSVEYSLGSKPKGFLKLYKVQAPPLNVTSNAPLPPGFDYYAITETTRSYAEISRINADELLRNINAIVQD